MRRAHAPPLAVHARPALAVEILERLARRANHLLTAAHHRAPARAQQHAYDEDEERPARRRDAADQRVRDLEPRQVAIDEDDRDRKSTRLNSSHLVISYAVFCLKQKHKSATA